MRKLYILSVTLFLFLIFSPAVFSGEIVSLEIYPRPVELSVGDEVLLRVVGRNSEGRIFPVLFPVWSVDEKELGRFSSLNEPVTTFTAEKKGKGKIFVLFGDVLCEQEIIIYDTLPPANDLWPKRNE